VHRSFLAATVAVVSGVAALPVVADPGPVDTGRMAATSVVAALGDGESIRLDIRAAELSSGPWLRVIRLRCDDRDCTQRDFAGGLAPDALSIDGSAAQADLSMTLAGRRLLITWAPDDTSTATVGGGEVGGEGLSASGSDYVGSPATVTVQYDGQRCVGRGGVGQAVTAQVSDPTGSDRAGDTLEDLRVPEAFTLRC
jgi:hypothetical protein